MTRLGAHGDTRREDRESASASRAIDAWLDVLASMLRVKADERDAIVDELRDHLTRRMFDRMLAGRHEDDAALDALRELGDAASVARQYTKHDAHFSRRRTMMTYGALGLGAAATALSVTVLTSSVGDVASPVDTSVFDDHVTLDAFADTLAGRDFPIGEVALDEAFDALRAASEVSFTVVWTAFLEEGFSGEDTFDITSGDAALAFAELTDLLRAEGVDIAWRDDESGPRLATAAYFDAREVRLAAYDLQPLFDAGVDIGELQEAVTMFVHPTYWANNGGRLARMQIVGEHLFIEAPARTHAKTRWIIGQVIDAEPLPGAHAGAGPGLGRGGGPGAPGAGRGLAGEYEPGVGRGGGVGGAR